VEQGKSGKLSFDAEAAKKDPTVVLKLLQNPAFQQRFRRLKVNPAALVDAMPKPDGPAGAAASSSPTRPHQSRF